MDGNGSSKSRLFLCFCFAFLVSQSLVVTHVTCSRNFELDQKTYYPPASSPLDHPEPFNTRSSKMIQGIRGSHGGHHSHNPSPSHGSGGGGSCGGNCGTPPSDGGHGSYTPTPSTPSTPSGGGGSYTPTPSTPSDGHGSYTPTPSTPSDGHHSHNPSPSNGSGGGGNSGGNCGTPPSGGSHGSYTPTPSTPSTPTPVVETPPSTPTPVVETPPYTSTPTTPPSPFLPDPNAPPPSPGTCNYWRSNPTAIWGLFGWWGTVGNLFGVPTTTSTPLGTGLTLPQALANTRTDGFGALYREGTASLLNSMVNARFPFTTHQVMSHFTSALVSDHAAATQAERFKQANEGRLKPRA